MWGEGWILWSVVCNGDFRIYTRKQFALSKQFFTTNCATYNIPVCTSSSEKCTPNTGGGGANDVTADVAAKLKAAIPEMTEAATDQDATKTKASTEVKGKILCSFLGSFPLIDPPRENVLLVWYNYSKDWRRWWWVGGWGFAYTSFSSAKLGLHLERFQFFKLNVKLYCVNKYLQLRLFMVLTHNNGTFLLFDTRILLRNKNRF